MNIQSLPQSVHQLVPLLAAISALLLLLPLLMGCHSGCHVVASEPNASSKVGPSPDGGQQVSAHNNANGSAARKCSRQSIILARQTLMHEFDIINQYTGSLWLYDLDKEELLEEQKKSLSSIIMSGASDKLLTSDGQPMLELEASYFKPSSAAVVVPAVQQPAAASSNRSAVSWLLHQMVKEQQQQQQQQQPLAGSSNPHHSAITIKLQRRHPDRCHLSRDSTQFTYSFGLIVGPLEHHLDVVYNLPKELRLSQPTDKQYGQIRVLVPKMHYEITVKQAHDYKFLAATSSPLAANCCPLEVSDVTYLGNPPPPPANVFNQANNKPYNEIQATGLAATNQTIMQLERLFNDYTRPTVSNRLRQALKFHLFSKTLPLSV